MRSHLGLPRISDESAFWISIGAPKIRLFCNPFEHLAGQRWHEVYSRGEWDVAQMLGDHADALVHSSVHIRRKTGEPWGVGSLFFKISEDIFVFGDLDYVGEGLLSF